MKESWQGWRGGQGGEAKSPDKTQRSLHIIAYNPL